MANIQGNTSVDKWGERQSGGGRERENYFRLQNQGRFAI